MNAGFLSRIQFALTASFHFFIGQYSWVMVVIGGLCLKVPISLASAGRYLVRRLSA
jgi:cytochrome bd-type quinol oxidase subunit 1